MEDDKDIEEAFRYGPFGWLVGLLFSAALLWMMFGLADPI